MKLIVFTPANTRSAIGRMAALVTRELVAQEVEVTVVRTEARHLQSTDVHDFGARILPWDDEAEVRALIRSSDAGIYQIGNSFEFHEGGVRWLEEFPGLVCLHDFFLGHLFYGWAKTHRIQAQAVLQRWYEEEMAERFFSFSDSESFIEGTCEVMPMTEWICSQADGVVTHSGWGCDRVLNSCPGPVRVVPLAYDAPAALANTTANTSADDRTLQLLTIGHVNPNKRIASVIQAIGLSSLLRNSVSYRLVGAVEPEMKNLLLASAAQLGVSLVISGEIDDNELQQAIAESDVVSCLRWPALEAASASAIEAMLYSKALIVTDTGFYSEIPDSCAIKINQSDEINEIRTSLERLVENRELVVKLGESANRWASKNFIACNYAMHLIDINKRILMSAPAKKAIDNFFTILSGWGAKNQFMISPSLVNNLNIFES